ncbi:MAG: hypothetical protein WBB37_07080 [bacterium]
MNSRKRCIYCGSSGPFSKEHAIPYSLGQFKGFPELIDMVCADCNNRNKLKEEQFLRCGPEAFIKKFLGITGRKKHKKVNIFERGSAGAPPIDFIGYDPNLGINILFEFNPGQQTIREVNKQIVFINKIGEFFPLRVPDWIEDNKQFLKYIKEKVPKGNYDARFFGDDEFLQRMKILTSGIGKNFTISGPSPETTVETPKTVYRVTDLYFRAIAKIAFHYLLAVVDFYRGDEDIFKPIRDFVINGGVVEDFVKQKSKEPIEPVLPNWWTHIIKMDSGYGGIFIYLQFFINTRDNPLPDMLQNKFMVRLSRNHVPPKLINRRCHHFVYYQPIQKVDGYYGKVIESEFKD